MHPPAILAEIGGWQAISDNNGIAIAITGMAIVFVALTLITVFIATLPRVLEALGPWLPNLESHTVAPPTDAERTPAEEEQIVAAIGYVLHAEAQRATKP